MKKNNYTRYFRFLKNDTAINDVSTNDFKSPVKFQHIAATTYFLITKAPFYYGFLSRTRAMEMAKAGALEYMETLIDQGRSGMDALLKYRDDHYEDLNETLTYAHIEAIKNQNIPS
jgi:hypothetical protein